MSLITLNNYFKESNLSSETYARLCSLFHEACVANDYPCVEPDLILEKTVSRFESLDEDQKRYILNHLVFYTELYTTILKNKLSPKDNKKHLWIALGLLGLTPPSDLFEVIDDSDCIEIYDGTGIQCYRDYTFSSLVSYSLPETLYSPWFDLYFRPPELLGLMQSEAGYAFTQAKTHFNSKIPKHISYETNTDKQKEFTVEFKKISPLFDKAKTPAAFLVTSQVEFIKNKKKKEVLHEV